MRSKLSALFNGQHDLAGSHKKTKSITLDEMKNMYRSHPSFANHLPWMEYDKKSRCFLLEDGLSVAVGLELEDVACDSRSQEFLNDLRNRFQRLFQDAVPQEQESPWILQFYVQDEDNLNSCKDDLTSYIKPERRNTVLTQNYLNTFGAHCDYMTRDEGLFQDNEVSGNIFRGKKRKIRLFFYRKIAKSFTSRRGRSVLQDANAVAKNIIHQLKSSGVNVRRINAEGFLNWMRRWFNPHPALAKGKVEDLIKNNPYPGDDELPFGYDFAEQIFSSVPESNEEDGLWFFDQWPHKFITIQTLSQIPHIGHLSAERSHSKSMYALLDKLPLGSCFSLTVVIEDQNSVRQHIKNITKSAVGIGPDANLTREDCAQALYEIEQGNYLYPTIMGVYISAPDTQTLLDRELDIEILLNNNGLKPIRGEVDLVPLDAYLRYLPMCYDFNFDKKYTFRSRYVYARQIANLVPLYGRNRGTNHPGINRYNRGGEPFTWDPFNRHDKSFNSHTLYFGSTGSGKSSAIVGDLLQVMAIHRPRLIIIEAGNSFGLFADYCLTQGLTVNKVQLKMSDPIALNPFADGLKLLDQIDLHKTEKIDLQQKALEKTLTTLNENANMDELLVDDERDILGEMALSAQLMITGGETKEEDKITRQDRLLILNALIDAARLAKNENAIQMLAEHVVRAMRNKATQLDLENSSSESVQGIRLREMANGMEYFCIDNLTSLFFNRPGTPWPDVDVTVLDMGIMSRKGYETPLALAVMGILNRVASMAEQNQYSERMTLLVTDESHVVTKNPLTAAAYTMHSKMSRKLGWWLWFATQNMGDFPEEARKMLSMIEFWIIMGTSDDEIQEIKRFKSITDEHYRMLLSIRKEMGKYTEAVVLSPKVTGLFRNIPPRLVFALAQTEKDEKSLRQRLMNELKITEIEAAIEISKRLVSKSWIEQSEEQAS